MLILVELICIAPTNTIDGDGHSRYTYGSGSGGPEDATGDGGTNVEPVYGDGAGGGTGVDFESTGDGPFYSHRPFGLVHVIILHAARSRRC